MPRLRQKCWWTNILVSCTAMAFVLVAQHGIASAQSQGPRWGTFVNLASLTKSDGYQRVTYKARGPNWFVLSGLRSIEGREQVFYEKYLFGAGSKTIHAVVVTYPAELKAIYDPLVGRIGNSLHGS